MRKALYILLVLLLVCTPVWAAAADALPIALTEASTPPQAPEDASTETSGAADGEAGADSDATAGETLTLGDVLGTDGYALPTVYCSSYAVIDRSTGQVLIEKNGTERAYPASTTKIMTMGLTLASGIDLNTKLTTSAAALSDISSDSTQLYLAVGEQMTVRDFLYGAQVRSANDGANVLAEGVAGSIDRFVQMMNDQAHALGLTGTHFVNPHGLPDENHYTTAIDLAQITRWALSVDGFADVFSAYTYTTGASNVTGARAMTTTCDILNPTQSGYYEYATGAKLGWTVASKYTLSTAASRNGMDLVCVVLGESMDTYLYADTAALLDYCFTNFHRVTLEPEVSAASVPVYDDVTRTGSVEIGSETFSILLHNSLTLSNILTAVNIPESYTYGDAITPTASFSLKASSPYQYVSLGEYTLPFVEQSLEGYENAQAAVLDVTSYQRPFAEIFRELIWVVVPVGFMILFLLVALFIQLFGKKTSTLRYNKYR